jgi:hypothetical protein
MRMFKVFVLIILSLGFSFPCILIAQEVDTTSDTTELAQSEEIEPAEILPWYKGLSIGLTYRKTAFGAQVENEIGKGGYKETCTQADSTGKQTCQRQRGQDAIGEAKDFSQPGTFGFAISGQDNYYGDSWFGYKLKFEYYDFQTNIGSSLQDEEGGRSSSITKEYDENILEGTSYSYTCYLYASLLPPEWENFKMNFALGVGAAYTEMNGKLSKQVWDQNSNEIVLPGQQRTKTNAHDEFDKFEFAGFGYSVGLGYKVYLYGFGFETGMIVSFYSDNEWDYMSSQGYQTISYAYTF